MGRYISLSVLLVLLVPLGIMFYQLMSPFLLPIFLAAVTAIVASPFYHWILNKSGDRRVLAASFTTGFLVTLVLLPTLVITVVAATQLAGFVQPFLALEMDQKKAAWREVADPWMEAAASWVPNYTSEQLQADLQKSVKDVTQHMSSSTLSLASSTMGAFVGFMVATSVYLLSLYYFFAEGQQFVQSIRDMIPVAPEQQQRMILEFTKVTRAVVTATLLAAVVQGVMTAGALYLLGFGNFLVYLVLSTLMALVPIIGAWGVWLPASLWLMANGHYASGIGLAIYGTVAVSLADNVVRMYVLNTDAQLHPLLALLSVMGALNVMGLWGIFIGPIIAACFTAALQIANQELRIMLQERRELQRAL